jgi:hypothetical protein
MKATIKGITYDTDSAILVGQFTTPNLGPATMAASLYQTPRSGRYFVVGTGGYLTRFDKGPRILPVSDGVAKLIKNTVLRGRMAT